jgi:hypothetical protein
MPTVVEKHVTPIKAENFFFNRIAENIIEKRYMPKETNKRGCLYHLPCFRRYAGNLNYLVNFPFSYRVHLETFSVANGLVMPITVKLRALPFT